MAIEVFKVEEVKGHGGILSDEFVQWRNALNQHMPIESHVENNTMRMNGMHVTAGDASESILTNIPMS